MRFDVVTLFPELFGPHLSQGVTRRAFESGLVDVRWSSTVVAVRPQADGAQVDIESVDGLHTVFADWLVACDGGRSTVREQLGLQL